MLLLFISSFLYGLSYPLADRVIGDVDALEFAFHFLLVLTIIQLPMAFFHWREIRKMTLVKELRLLMVAGFVGAFLYWCEFSSLNVGLPISHLTFLSLTVPAWALLYEWMRGRGTTSHLNKWVLAIVGSAVLIAPNAKGEFSFGILLPILTSLLMAFWLIYSKKCQEIGISPVVCSFFNDLFSLIGITLLILVNSRFESFTVPQKIPNLAFYALVIGVLPNILLLYGLRVAKVTSAALIIMLEPVIIGAATILATKEEITVSLLTGVLLISVSNLPDNAIHHIKRLTAYYSLNIFK